MRMPMCQIDSTFSYIVRRKIQYLRPYIMKLIFFQRYQYIISMKSVYRTNDISFWKVTKLL